MTARNGSAEWQGSVESGSGTITVGEGVLQGPYSYESRFGEGEGTNPRAADRGGTRRLLHDGPLEPPRRRGARA